MNARSVCTFTIGPVLSSVFFIVIKTKIQCRDEQIKFTNIKRVWNERSWHRLLQDLSIIGHSHMWYVKSFLMKADNMRLNLSSLSFLAHACLTLAAGGYIWKYTCLVNNISAIIVEDFMFRFLSYYIKIIVQSILAS